MDSQAHSVQHTSFTALLELRALELPSKIRSRDYDLPKPASGRSFKDVLRDAEAEFKGCNDEIARLQSRLIDLKHNRRDLQELLEISGSLSAPARRLPADVLGVIFSYYVHHDLLPPSTLDQKFQHIDLTPLKLGWICSPWRDAALTHGALWSNIAVYLSASSANATYLPEILEELLKRSRECPLTLAVLETRRWDPVITQPNSSHPLFSLLVKHAHRWKNASLRVPRSMLAQLSESSVHMPLLESLHLQVINELFDPVFAFSEAPKLQDVTLYNTHWSQVMLSKSVRSLTLAGFSSNLNESAMRLSHFENLENLYIRALGTAGLEVVEPITLPSVKTLVLDIRREQDELYFLGKFFSSFTIPVLNNLCIMTDDSTAQRPADEWHAEAFAEFVRRSNCHIQTLALTGVYESFLAMSTVLRAVPTLTNLHLAERTHYPFLTTDLFKVLTVGGSIFETPMLAHLLNLKLTVYGPREEYAAHAMVQLITSRWRPSTTSSAVVSCLQSVDIVGNKAFIEAIDEDFEIESICRAGLRLKTAVLKIPTRRTSNTIMRYR